MTNTELKKLSRSDLLEILVEQSERIESLELELRAAQAELEDRRITISRAGSIAEASLELNKIFQAAENAAQQYLENIERLSGNREEVFAKLEAESQKKAANILLEAKRKSEAMIAEAKRNSQKYWDEVISRTKTLMLAQEDLNRLIKNGKSGNESDHE